MSETQPFDVMNESDKRRLALEYALRIAAQRGLQGDFELEPIAKGVLNWLSAGSEMKTAWKHMEGKQSCVGDKSAGEVPMAASRMVPIREKIVVTVRDLLATIYSHSLFDSTEDYARCKELIAELEFELKMRRS